MPEIFSFDIVSEINLQEVDNAVNQATKEILQRYDFKGSKTAMELDLKAKTLTVSSDDDFKLKSAVDILQSKLIKRGVPVKALSYGPREPATAGTVRQVMSLRVGIDKENARLLVKMIKETKLKVQSQIMDTQVRVSGKNKDDLQTVMQKVKNADLVFAVQFVNLR